MCLIICAEADKPLSLPLFENVMKRNKDGFGLMVSMNNKMVIKKLDKASSNPADAFAIYEKYKDYHPILHFRMRTHGDEDAENTHPFYCGYGIWMMHNGVISSHTQGGSNKSDTWHFVRDILKPLFRQVINPHKFFRTACFAQMIQDYIGSTNRIILMDRGGAIRFNDSAWYTVKDKETGFAGTVVSNTYAWDEKFYKPEKPQYPSSGNVHVYGSRWNAKKGQYEVPSDDDDSDEYTAWSNHTRYHQRGDSNNWRNLSFASHVEPLFADWCVDKEKKIWRRDTYGFVRAHHMDDSLVIKNAVEELEKAKQAKTNVIPFVVTNNNPTEPAYPSPTPTQMELIEKDDEVEEESVVVRNDDDEADFNDSVNKMAHERSLVEEWKKYQEHEINTLVYADTEEAVTVLCALLRDAR